MFKSATDMITKETTKKKNPAQPKRSNESENWSKKENSVIPDGLCGDGGFRPPLSKEKEIEWSYIRTKNLITNCTRIPSFRS